MKFTDYKTKEKNAKITELEEKIALIESETPKKLMATLMPVEKAVQKLNQEVGLWELTYVSSLKPTKVVHIN